MIIKKHVLKWILFLAIVMLGVTNAPDQKAYAAVSAVKVCAVSYVDESVLVFTNENTRIYYATEADASKNNWDVVNVNTGEEIAVIDISWMSANTENILKIKGDGDATQSRIIVKRIPQKLEVTIDYSSIDSLDPDDNIGQLVNIMASEGDGISPITFQDLEWRKGENGRWMDTQFLTRELLESYQAKGTYVYFRIKPVDAVVKANVDISSLVSTYAYTKPNLGITSVTSYPNGTEGRRASNEVKLRIAKKTILPVSGVDGEDFTVSIKYGQEYRVSVNGGTPSNWTQVTDRSAKDIPLATIVKDPSMDGLAFGKEFKQMVIEIRQYATAKAPASKINSINLSAQRKITGNVVEGKVPSNADASDKNIYITYNGSTDLSVTIPSASELTPYEYCVVKQGSTFDLERTSWTPISKSASVKILASKAPDFSTIYIRMKEIKYKAATSTKPAVAFELASTYKTFSVGFPAVPTANKATYTYTKGYSADIVIPFVLNVTGKLPFETEPLSIKLGTKEVPFEYTTTATGTLDPNIIYTMNITIKAATLDDLANCSARALYIYFKNGTVDKTSVKLTIKNPTAASSLTATIKQGTNPGTTAFDMVTKKPATSNWVFFVSNAVVADVNKEDTISLVAANAGVTTASVINVTGDGADNIAVTAGKYLTIFEIDGTNHILKYKSYQINTDKIKPTP